MKYILYSEKGFWNLASKSWVKDLESGSKLHSYDYAQMIKEYICLKQNLFVEIKSIF